MWDVGVCGCPKTILGETARGLRRASCADGLPPRPRVGRAGRRGWRPQHAPRRQPTCTDSPLSRCEAPTYGRTAYSRFSAAALPRSAPRARRMAAFFSSARVLSSATAAIRRNMRGDMLHAAPREQPREGRARGFSGIQIVQA
eukprot:scaffold20566_cov135-Isochrysis_galbana.AAC.3